MGPHKTEHAVSHRSSGVRFTGDVAYCIEYTVNEFWTWWMLDWFETLSIAKFLELAEGPWNCDL